MVLNIKNEEAYELAKEISVATGKSLTRVVIDALKAERKRVVPRTRKVDLKMVYEALEAFDKLPTIDPRPIEEIVADMYDERGLPK